MNPLIKHSHHLSSVSNKSSLYSQTLYQKRFPSEQKKAIKRSKTQNVIEKVRKTDILNEQERTKVPSKNNNSKIRYFGSNFDRVIKFKSSDLQKIKQQRKIDERQTIYNAIQQDKQKTMKVHKNNQKLLQKITDHRRVRSSSKISSRIISLNTFFKEPKIQSKGKAIQRLKSQILQPKLAQEALQNILQLKLRTQNEPIQCSNELLSFRNTFSSSGNSKFGFTFGSNLHRTSKMNDILSKQQLNNSKQVIKLNEQMRKSKNLKPNPKQWQFHNCLTLQKIQLYSTNLKISCQGWVVLDHLELKYLRGWNPKLQDDFSPLIRLFVAKICYDLPEIANYPLDIQKILIRVNDKHIYKDQRQNHEKTRGINPHSILNLKKLITAMLITSHDDLVVYSILALGYILFLINNNLKQNIRQQRDPLEKIKKSEVYEIFIESTQKAVLQLYCQHFERECHKICLELDIPKTRVVVGFNCLYNDYNKKIKNKHNNFHEYTVSSSPLDMSVLFMKCLGDKKFKEALSHRIYEAQIRYQVGWNFWETRNQKWTNEQYVKYRLKAVGGRSNKGNQCFSIWDDQRDILITMADCKINMHWKDTERIQDWIFKNLLFKHEFVSNRQLKVLESKLSRCCPPRRKSAKFNRKNDYIHPIYQIYVKQKYIIHRKGMSMRSELQFETYLLDLSPTPIAELTTAKQQFTLKQIHEHIPISKINHEPVFKYVNHCCNKAEESDKITNNGFEIRTNKKYSGNKFNLLDPWSENDFQITQYHKKQEKDLERFKKISKNSLKSRQSNFTNRSSIGINNSTQRDSKQGFFNKSSQRSDFNISRNICEKQKTLSSRTQYEKDEKFNTVTTSTQERLKWHLQMEVMVKRRKKLTNMLKLRHFGYLKPNSNRHQYEKDKCVAKKFNFKTENYSSQNFVSASERKYQQDQIYDLKEREKEILRNKLQSYCDSFEDSFIYTKVNIQENDQQEKQKQMKEKQKQKKPNRFSFNRHKEQTNMQIEQLYSALRTYTQKNRIIQKGSFSSSPSRSVDRARTDFKKQFISQMKSSNFKSNAEVLPQQKNSYGIKNSVPFKKKFSSIIIQSDEKRSSSSSCFECKGKQKNHPESSVSLNMQLNKTGYTGHSIKNKLKLIQSNLMNNRSKSRGNKNKVENEHVEEVSCLQKKQRQIRIKNFNI